MISKIYRFFIIICIVSNYSVSAQDIYSIATAEISFIIPGCDRKITAEVYYPVDFNKKIVHQEIDYGIWKRQTFNKDALISKKQEKYPLVVFSHGFQGNRFGNSWIAEKLVEKGYIVAVIDHTYNTSYDHSDLFIYTSMWQRPLDMKALLDYLLENEYWKEQIDQTKIVAGGFSLGGLTALWLAGIEGSATLFKDAMTEYAQFAAWPQEAREIAENVDWKKAEISYKDPRIKAVFSMAPGLGVRRGFSAEGIKKGDIPTLILVGDQDVVTPAEINASFFAKNMKIAEIVIFENVRHFTFLNCPSELGKTNVPYFFNDSSLINRKDIHERASKEIINFLSKIFSK